MSHDLGRSPAEERLLDAALAQVFSRRRAAPATARPWFAAALVLFSVAVTAASMWLVRGAARDAAQEPAPLPPQVRAEGKAAIEALPVDTENLAAVILQPDHAAVLSRFRKLRRLVLSPLDVHVAGINTRKKLSVWDAPPADLLAPITELRSLASLQLASAIAVSPVLLEPLRRCTSLRELELHGAQVRLDDAFVTALAAIPSLRSLRFDLVRVDAAAVAKLRTTPITALHLSRTPGFDAEVWTALCSWHGIEELSFRDLGQPNTFTPKGTVETFWRPDPDQLRRLAALPSLRSLAFHACELRDDDLQALPAALTELHVSVHELTPAGVAELKRFGALRTLDVALGLRRTLFDQRAAAQRTEEVEAFAEAIAALRLTTLRYYGKLSPALRQAIAAQPDLAVLELTTDRFAVEDLTAFANAPALRHLQLLANAIGDGVSPDVLAPLQTSRSLRTIDLHVNEVRGGPGLDEAALQKQLGDGVTLRVHRSLFTIKR